MINKKTIYCLGLLITTANIFSHYSLTQAQTVQPLTPENQQILAQSVNSDQPKIQVAILLDSSNSMDGLIDQARTQIWSVVNALNNVTKNGKPPLIEVSLYHYGNDTLPSAEGFNRMLNELTTDLDLISENLFSIKTKGGQEYAGWVIDSAIKQLKWSNNPKDFRVVFIAGNEPFDQGSINWQKSINSATAKDIIVNTIYCGDSEKEESNLWANAANEGKGSYFNLNQNQKIATIPTPYDAEIARLNRELNETYIYYGLQGRDLWQRQMTQDSNAFRSSSNAGYDRARSKSSGSYRNSSWDLVDAVTDDRVDLNKIDTNLLPEKYRRMPIPDLHKKIEEMRKKREEIKAKIAELGKKRAEYIAKNTPKQDVDKTLDNLMISALYKQLETRGFEIKNSLSNNEKNSNDISVSQIAAKASGLCLCEVTELREKNGLAADGDHYILASLKPIRQSGFVPKSLYLVKAYGGRRFVSLPLPKILKYDSLNIGEKYWMFFAL